MTLKNCPGCVSIDLPANFLIFNSDAYPSRCKKPLRQPIHNFDAIVNRLALSACCICCEFRPRGLSLCVYLLALPFACQRFFYLFLATFFLFGVCLFFFLRFYCCSLLLPRLQWATFSFYICKSSLLFASEHFYRIHGFSARPQRKDIWVTFCLSAAFSLSSFFLSYVIFIFGTLIFMLVIYLFLFSAFFSLASLLNILRSRQYFLSVS